jgi:FG-GAP-like repeat/HYDIN/CFA65/VesB-like, Ig-like domain/FG-GAP repeat
VPNPVPLLDQPLVPTAAVPGSASFTLAVNGTGFVSGSVVMWNGSARTTTFVSRSQVKASILATDIATVGTAAVTISNPGPGGGVSNVVFFQVTNAAASVALTYSSFSASLGARTAVAADFNGDGEPDLAVCHGSSGATISILLGNGDGTFQSPVNYPSGTDTTHLTVGDFNGDGKLDLVATNGGDDTVSILLGNGDGSFQARMDYNTGAFPIEVATGDFNGDGQLDVAVTNASANTMSILLGSGDGTLQAHVDYAAGIDPQGVFVGDFNGDGKLDIATANTTDSSVSILLGNGDGSFNPHVDYVVGSSPQSIAGADVNGDGKLDLLVPNTLSNSVSVLLGNGDGTFAGHVDYTTAADPTSVAIGDLNGDGNVDLVTADCLSNTCVNPSSISTLLGNGDGTFQTHIDFTTGYAPLSVSLADFNGDGMLDIATPDANGNVSILLQIVPAPNVVLSAAIMNFNTQLVNTSSAPPQNLMLTNSGGAALTISSIAITGADASDFSETDTCGAGIAAGANCTISVTFKPSSSGTRSASVTVTDNASGSPHTISLTGTGTDFSLGAGSGANCPTGGNCSTSTTITAGGTATYNLQVSPDSGFNGKVALSCSNAPSPSSCIVSPTTVPPNGTSNYAFTVTVSNTSGVAAVPLRLPRCPIRLWDCPIILGLLVAVPALMLFTRSFFSVRQKRYALASVLGLLLSCLAYTTGCGTTGGASNQKQPVNATFTIAGTSSSVTHTVSLSLTVNP